MSLTSSATAVHVVHPTHCPELGPICLVRDEPAQLHDQWFTVSELRAIAEYPLFPRLSVEVQLPFRVSATSVQFRRLDGTPFVPDYENIHHRNETLLGVGDAWLTARGALAWNGYAFIGRLGATLPLGRIEPNPFALGEEGLAHQHVQFGTGTVNPLLGLDVVHSFGAVDARLYGQLQLSLAENRYGYRAGTRGLAGVEVGTRVVGALHLSGALDVFNEQPERWDGVIQQDGNLGRTDLLVGVTASYPVSGFLLTAGMRVPVYQRLIQSADEAGQLTYPGIVNLGLQRTFDLTGR